jgi:thiol-disulfide isomerase/thioredoxin
MNPENIPASPDTAVDRRYWLLAGWASAATMAGATLSWWRSQPQDSNAAEANSVWDASFPTPSGGQLTLQKLKGRPLLVNFWATWCPPCVEEMPLLDSFYRQNSVNGWQIVGLAIDQALAVESFLQRIPVSFPIGLAGTSGAALGKLLGNYSGGLPFTVFFSAAGSISRRKIGKLSTDDLAIWQQSK